MNLTPQNKTYFNRPLEDVLTSFYSAAALKEIHAELFAPFGKPAAQEVKLTKARLVEQFMQQLSTPAGVRELINRMSPALKDAIHRLLWISVERLDALHQGIGRKLARPKPPTHRSRYGQVDFEFGGAAELLAISAGPGRMYRYGDRQPQEEHYIVTLPPALKKLFKDHFPKPRYYNWEPLPEAPAGGASFDASGHMANDFAVLADYLQRAHVSLNKQGKIGKSALRAMADLSKGGDFAVADTKDKALELARHELLGRILLEMPEAMLQDMRSHPFPARKILPKLIPQLCKFPEVLMELLTPHLKLRSYYHEPEFKQEPLEVLFGTFASLPVGEWISAENLVRYVWLREIPMLYFPYTYYRFKLGDSSPAAAHRFYGSTEELDEDTVFDAAVIPTLYGTAFLLAAMGLLEILYTSPPEHRLWHIGKTRYLSRWDGLMAVRLTPAGAFCFGKTRSLDLELPEARNNAIRFNGPRLLAFSSSDDPITRQALEEFLERIGPGVYRFSATRLFKGCFEKKHLTDRIDEFRRRMDVELPREWEDKLAGILNAPAPLVRNQSFAVYQIADDPRLRELFATDPLLRTACLRVEGWRVAIHANEVKKVREHLRSLGYFLEGDVGLPTSSASLSKPRKKVPKRRRTRYY